MHTQRKARDISTVIDLTDSTAPLVFAAVTDPQRVEAVTATGLLDGEADAVLDRIARLASSAVGAPISFVTLVAEDRQLMPGAALRDAPDGVVRQLPLEQSFCPFAVATGEPLVIEDKRQSALVRDSPAGRSEVSAYAGVPLRTTAGHVLGTMCVMDRDPRQWRAEELALLDDLAALAVHELDLRIAERRVRQQSALARTLVERVKALGDVAGSLIERAERADDARLQRYAALTRGRTERAVSAAQELQTALARPDVTGGPDAARTDLRRVVERAVTTARAATGSSLLHLTAPDSPVLLSCDSVEIERSVTHLLLSALSYLDGETPVDLRLTHTSGDGATGTAVLSLEAAGARVPTGELSRVVARFAQVTCGTTAAGEDAGGAQVRVSRGTVLVRSGDVKASSSAAGTSFTARWSTSDERVLVLPALTS